MLPRRHSRASCRSSSSTCGDPSMNHATTEELSFARLMAVLSIIFVVCWVPQLTTIIVAQLVGSNPLYKEIYKVADLFIALNFTLDPYMYVLFRRQQRYTNRHLRKLMTYVCPYALQPSPRRALIGSVRSSSHTSHNTNGVCNGDAVAVSDAALGDVSAKHTVSTNTASSEKEYVPLQLLLASSKTSEVSHKSSVIHHDERYALDL
ncbi:hypothetical protein OTU49_000609 [Cherax quadricarinatus]|uniref:G-protein coupled receptors family 1 profile domain-containing protein n=1 Tax=Cherax quadricarinatus TaxID=27406 RepID=A0AAW0XYP4_CHEQU